MDGKIFDLCDYLLEHLDHDWSVNEMAARTGLSASHFFVLFKSELGMPPAAWLKEKRLERARYLLETTHDHIKQIGIRVGMPNESHFTRDFKKRYGLTPKQYRRQFQEKRQAKLLMGRSHSFG